MTYQTLLFEIRDGIAFVTINRPDKLNALNDDVMKELGQAAERIATESEIKGAILTGAGPKSFVAGADIGDLSRQGPFDGKARAQRGQGVLRRLETCGKPVIAAINGFALGGGCELAMACHIRIATENAKFGQPEVTLGLIPGYGGTQRLSQLVGRGKAFELLLTADMITAYEAKALGLVNHVVSNKDDLMALANSIMKKIIANAPIAIANTIKSINAGYEFEGAGYRTEAENFAACTETEDFKEGTTAFIQKRKPNFTGK